MAQTAVKKVKVCKKCSGFDVTELRELGLKVKDHTTGCIGKCKGSDPALAAVIFDKASMAISRLSALPAISWANIPPTVPIYPPAYAAVFYVAQRYEW